MIATAHITTGAAIGLALAGAITNRWPESQWLALPVAFAAGVVSHHIADLIPHTDTGSFRDPKDKGLITDKESIFALFDNILGTALVLTVFFTLQPSWPMLLGAAGANFPDVFHHPRWWAPYTRALFNGQYYRFHSTYHFTARGAAMIFIGIATTALAIGTAMWYISSN